MYLIVDEGGGLTISDKLTKDVMESYNAGLVDIVRHTEEGFEIMFEGEFELIKEIFPCGNPNHE